jgi:hypothetical protein
VKTLPAEVFEAQEYEHQLEIAKLTMRVITYRIALEEAGIEPPDDTGEELLAMWRDCRHLIHTAQTMLANLGTSKEMLARFS